MIIDFHTHTFPERIAAGAIAHIQSLGHSMAFTDGTAPGLTASMARAGVSWSVVLPVATNPMKLPSMNNVSLAQNGQNSLICFGAAHPLAPDWESELERIAAAGLRGIKIHPLYQGVDITDIRYLRLIGRAAELGLVTVMHTGDDIAYPGQVRCSPEMTADALHQLGDIPIVLAHMGGWKNWERVADCLGPTCAMIDTALSLGRVTPLEEDYYEAQELALMNEEAFCRMVRAFGSQRVLFGTDSPWGSQGADVAQIRSLPLTDREKTDIFSSNARRLLGL